MWYMNLWTLLPVCTITECRLVSSIWVCVCVYLCLIKANKYAQIFGNRYYGCGDCAISNKHTSTTTAPYKYIRSISRPGVSLKGLSLFISFCGCVHWELNMIIIIYQYTRIWYLFHSTFDDEPSIYYQIYSKRHYGLSRNTHLKTELIGLEIFGWLWWIWIHTILHVPFLFISLNWLLNYCWFNKFK